MLIETYPYLVFSLVALGISLVVLLLYRQQRRLMLWSAVLSAPWALASVAFVPEYWTPSRIATFLVGPEDVIFSFTNGVLVWLLATWPVRHRITVDLSFTRIVVRYVSYCALGMSLGAVFRLLGFGVMSSALLTFLIAAILLLVRHRALWSLMLTGSVSFAVAYFAYTAVIFRLSPTFVNQWNAANLWGYFILGVPLEEVLWALGFGAIWPMLMAYSFEAKLDAASESKQALATTSVRV